MRNVSLAIFIAATSVFYSACSNSPDITFIPSGGSYSAEEIVERADEVPLGRAALLTVEEAPEARRRALVDLRTQGDAAERAASLVTRIFPAETSSVPLLVEAATVDDRSALLIVEAWGGTEGRLDSRRIWVIDPRTEDVILSATR